MSVSKARNGTFPDRFEMGIASGAVKGLASPVVTSDSSDSLVFS
jgi:hypothetical protein